MFGFVASRHLPECILLMFFIGSSCSSEGGLTPLVGPGSSVELELGLNYDGNTFDTGLLKGAAGVRYYVFDIPSGKLECFSDSDFQGDSSLDIRTGEKEVWALSGIDFSRFDSCLYLADFKRREVTLEEYAGGEGVPMVGNVTVRAYPEEKVSATIPMRRLAARLRVREIINSLSGPLTGLPIRIYGVFLVNVLGNCTVSGGCSESSRMIRDEIPGLTAVTVGKDCPYGQSLFPDASLLFLPYMEEPVTLVVVEAGISDAVYYYPVRLAGTRKNHSYDLVLEITRPGSSDPDSFVFGRAGMYSIEIEEFEDDSDVISIIY